jgi:hypothetical protein
MHSGYDREQIERILATLQESMRALVARTTITHDNQLSVAQQLLRSSYAGWEMKDVPATIPMVMRDMAICHDQNVDAEIARITNAFEIADRLIRQASGYNDEEEVEGRKRKGPLVNGEKVAKAVLEHVRKSESAKTLDDLILCCGDDGDRAKILKALRELAASGDVIELPGKPATFAAGLALDV